jgi:phosphate transport system substrate-binding protein
LRRSNETTPAGPLAQIPVAVFSIVPVYKLPGRSQVRFTGELLAQIYMGHITNWRDQRLARLNPDAVPPDLPITILQRPEGAGSRYIFTEFLAKTSPQFGKWMRGVNHESPKIVTVARSIGVVDRLAITPGAIGFTEYGIAVQFGLQYGLVQNASGKYVAPSPQSIDAASAAMQELVLSDSRGPLLNAPGENSYPLTSFAWVYVKRPHSLGTEERPLRIPELAPGARAEPNSGTRP